MSPERSIAHYRILSKLGEGGMGAVYRATDTKLNRDIAIKVLPGAFAEDPNRMARFAREAQVLATLNHPNIAAIYGVEDRAIVMELVPGETLRGPMPLEETLPIVHQLIDALEYAHEKGVVHRDLKPVNIKVTPDGRVKVLDFGLAKALSGETAATDPQSSPTLTMRASAAGAIMGTAAYMSPEQARGQTVDRRADIWAFGVVVYELLTGKSCFEGPTVSDTIAAVLTREPDLSVLPPRFRRLVSKCLTRDVRRRLRDISGAMLLLDEEPPAADAKSRSRVYGGWIAAGVLAIALAAVSSVSFRQPSDPAPLLRTSILLPGDLPFSRLEISPNGKHVAFTGGKPGKRQIWVRDLDSAMVRPLAGTESALRIIWSWDSRMIAFCAAGELKRIDIAGGPPVRLADCPRAVGGSWNQNGVILVSTGKDIVKVPAAGGAAVTVVRAPEGSFAQSPYFLPDGEHFLYTEGSPDSQKAFLKVGDLRGRLSKELLTSNSGPAYAEPGYLLYLDNGTLMAQPFNAGRLELTGEAITIIEGISNNEGFSVSSNGMLAYFSDRRQNRILKWFERSGKDVGNIGTPGRLDYPAISPDGSRIAYNRRERREGDIWLHDVARGMDTRFTSEPGTESHAVWSPDGDYIAYMRQSGADDEQMYRKRADALAAPEALGLKRTMAFDWSRDGRYLIGGSAITGKTLSDLWVLPMFGDQKSFPFMQTEFTDTRGKFSPGSDWVAYMSNRTGRNEVYLVNFPGANRSNQVSVSGGDYPIWSRDGTEIYYMGLDGMIWAAAVKGRGSALSTEAPKPLFRVPNIVTPRAFDVAKDGRFLIPVDEEDSAAERSITLVQNWTALLPSKAP